MMSQDDVKAGRIDELRMENAKLRSMCRRAADEITEHWDAHCDEEGYGPSNLVTRLAGNLPPAWYPAYAYEADKSLLDEDLARLREKHGISKT